MPYKTPHPTSSRSRSPFSASSSREFANCKVVLIFSFDAFNSLIRICLISTQYKQIFYYCQPTVSVGRFSQASVSGTGNGTAIKNCLRPFLHYLSLSFKIHANLKGFSADHRQPRAHGQPAGAGEFFRCPLSPFKNLACISFYGTDVFH